ncbi:MAG: chromate transporter, partial [Muribaculaceae bacterium]|nr:chromate transporter [Muribaculaceae bacterium]
LIASAALLLMNSDNFVQDTRQVVWSIILCAAAFVMVYFIKWHPILVICISGIAGYLIYI